MSRHYDFLDWPDDIKGMTVVAGEFVVATPEGADHANDQPVTDLLRRVREGLGMDIVFISQFADGQRIIRHVQATADNESEFRPGDCEPLEETFCKQIVDGRVPQLGGQVPAPPPGATGDAARQVGAYVTTPISAPDGSVFGTLCCISRRQRPELGTRSELESLQAVANLLSSVLERGS